MAAFCDVLSLAANVLGDVIQEGMKQEGQRKTLGLGLVWFTEGFSTC